jgi:hypothetical protein
MPVPNPTRLAHNQRHRLNLQLAHVLRTKVPLPTRRLCTNRAEPVPFLRRRRRHTTDGTGVVFFVGFDAGEGAGSTFSGGDGGGLGTGGTGRCGGFFFGLVRFVFLSVVTVQGEEGEERG